MLYTSYFYFGFAALINNEFENDPQKDNVLRGMGLEGTNKWTCTGVLFGIWGFALILQYIFIRWLNKEKK
jgi:hypothetical protein